MASGEAKKVEGGLTFDVVLQPARSETPPPTCTTPTRVRTFSQQELDEKLKGADERRQVLEAEKLDRLAKEKSHAADVVHKAAAENEKFARATEEKLTAKMEAMEMKKKAQLEGLQERLREHTKKVQEVRETSERVRSKEAAMLKEKLEQKMGESTEKREEKLKGIIERLSEHDQHVLEVLEASKTFNKDPEDKFMKRWDTSLKNREDQLQQIVAKLKEHEQHIDEVRKNKALRQQQSTEADAQDKS